MRRVIFAVFSCSMIYTAQAEFYFDINALNLSDADRQTIILDELIKSDKPLPGLYKVEIYLNKEQVDSQNITFVKCALSICPQLSIKQLSDFGINIAAFPALNKLPKDSLITDLNDYIPGASTEFVFNKLLLRLNIPQVALINTIRNDVPLSEWDDGVNMMFTNYNMSGSFSRKESSNNNQYVNLRSGFNFGAWRVRNYSYYNNQDGESTWKSLQSYIERDIRSLRSRLTMGEVNSNGLIFDSVKFKGIKLASDTQMLPESQRGFAPVIRGIAMSNAQVEIWQKGNLLYQTFVPPGEFKITDLYPTSTSGDLEIRIKEEDGTVRKSTQAFSAAPTMIREGQTQYTLNAGKFSSDNPSNKSSDNFVLGELIYGILNGTTLYGGIIGSQNYNSGAIGMGQSLGAIGAVSLDITQASAKINNNEKKQGQSFQIRYSKNITATETNLTLAGYRYSTEGYRSFEEANNERSNWQNATLSTPKNKIQLTINQSLGQYGSFSLSAYQQDYWSNNRGRNRSLNVSYNFNIADINLSFGYNNTSTEWNKTDQILSFNINMPLSRWLSSDNNYATLGYNTVYSDGGSTQNMATLSGSMLQNNNLNYSLSQSYSRSQQGSSDVYGSAATAQYSGTKGIANLGFNRDNQNNERINYGLQGSVVVHPYGLTLAQSLNENGASVLIRAQGASQTRVINQPNIVTNASGYAVIPYLTSYQYNNIRLDTSTLDDDVEVANPIHKVTPTQGALVLADFATSVGNRIFLKLKYRNEKIPFGALATVGNNTAIVNERGEVYLSGVKDKSNISISWNGQSCSVIFDQDKVKKINGIFISTENCQ